MQDITKISDKKEYDKVLYRILTDLESQVGQFRQFVLDSNIAMPFILDANGIIPKGYFQCNGLNGTYDLSSLEKDIPSGGKLIYIQKL